MNTIQATYQALAAGLHADPLLCLANAVCWLDPHWREADEEMADEDHLMRAMRVLRTVFPDIYVEAVETLRQGASYSQMDQLICQQVTQRGLPIDHLDYFGYGIPMPAYGASLEDPDFYTHHPDIRPIVALFGIDPEADEYSVDVPQCAYTAGQLITERLEAEADPCYGQLARLMGWLFSCTGNSSIDYNDDAMCECQPLSWDQDDLEFAREIIREADEMMADALAGLKLLEDIPSLMEALSHNIKRIYKALQTGKTNDLKAIKRTLHWPIRTPFLSSADADAGQSEQSRPETAA